MLSVGLGHASYIIKYAIKGLMNGNGNNNHSSVGIELALLFEMKWMILLYFPSPQIKSIEKHWKWENSLKKLSKFPYNIA